MTCSFPGKWVHLAMVMTEDSGTLTTKLYVNGHLDKTQITSNAPLGKPIGQSFKGIVLGNDVDGDQINDPLQFANAQIAGLYMFNRKLSHEEIQSTHRHQGVPARGRILSWEEFAYGSAVEGDAPDVTKIAYPKDLY